MKRFRKIGSNTAVLALAIAAGLCILIFGMPNIQKTPTPIPDKHSTASSSQATSRPAPLTEEDSETRYKKGLATVFWVGEPSGPENAYIPNHVSYWDDEWMTHFGGIDDPNARCGYHPCSFRPKENPFYVALPYGERTESHDDDNSVLRSSASRIPWFDEAVIAGEPLLKNRWVEVKRGDARCYGQWEDVGPREDNDFAYVFGNALISKNTFGVGAGIDLSPALFTCLKLSTNTEVEWRFVNAAEVPRGPWKEIVTTRGVSFTNNDQ